MMAWNSSMSFFITAVSCSFQDWRSSFSTSYIIPINYMYMSVHFLTSTFTLISLVALRVVTAIERTTSKLYKINSLV